MMARATVFMALVFLAGCSGPQLMSTNSAVPAAEGTVKTTDEDNGNTKVDVKVKHLAKPDQVEPSAKTYVVWAQDNVNNGVVQNLGALQVDDDLEGELKSMTSLKSFDVFITAEPVATAQYPTGDKALWTTVSN